MSNTNKTPQWEEELAKTLMEITAKYQTWNYAMNLYSPLKDFIKSTLEAERTRMIKALEGLKKELGRGVDELGRPESPAVIIQIAERRGFNSALDQAIKAVEKGK